MMRRTLSITLLLGVACLLPASAAGQAKARHPQHHIHAGEQPAHLETADDASSQTLTLRMGPLNLPAQTDHSQMPQAPEMTWTIPFAGWLLAYSPRLVDGSGNPVQSNLLHHVAFWHTGRSDFLCPNKEEHIFGAGGEMNQWPPLPGYGYPVASDDRIRINTMFHNPTDTSYPVVYLEVRVQYRRSGTAGSDPRSVYPTWLDVRGCGDSAYDLNPGPNVNSGEFNIKLAGTLLGLGGHLHNYGRRLEVDNATRGEMIATLSAKLDPQGRILEMPVVTFIGRGGYRLVPGHRIRVSATYENPTGKRLEEGAMGIAVGYFLPDDAGAMAAFERKTTAQKLSVPKR